MGIHWYPWISLDSNRSEWKAVVFFDTNKYPFKSMDMHRFPGISMDIHRFPWISFDIHGYPWICMEINGLPCLGLSPCTGVNFLMLIFLISNFELCFTSNLDFFSLFSSEWLFLSSKQVSWVNWWAKAILLVWRLMASWCSRFSYWAVKFVWRS